MLTPVNPYERSRTTVRASADPDLAARSEAVALVAQMTLDEKLDCLDGDTDFWVGLADMISGGYGEHTWPGGACPRLGIPGIAFSDGPRGKVFGPATCFPVSMARAATWDVDLEERIGDAIGAELRADGANYFGGVCINLLRHPAWGRAQETYGEDPVMLGEFGAALTRGAQRHLMACVKHYALNSMENARFQVDVTVDERALHEVYLPHFRRVIDEGVASVMSAYNSVNGSWCGHHRYLLTDVLRGQWGFEGFVISDFVSGLRDAAASVHGGMDIEMPFRMVRAQHLRAALDAGEISLDEIDQSIARTVTTQLRFDTERPRPEPAVVVCSEHVALAREAAQRSIVLLRNSGVLPLPADAGRIAVIGPLADVANTGDRGSSRVYPPHVVTPLEGLRDALGSDRIAHHPGDDPTRAAEVAASCDVAVVVVGYTHLDEGEYIGSTMAEIAALFPPRTEHDDAFMAAGFAKLGNDNERAMGTGGDRASLRLSAADEALIEAVCAANARTIVCVMSGSAVVMPWAELPAATLLLWYPGMEGGHALADVITGEVDASGRLPFTVPTNADDLPFFDRDATAITYDRWHGYTKLQHEGRRPHFAFGFGLSYTSFELFDLRLDEPATASGAGSTLRHAHVSVRNVGRRTGSTVVQMYAGMPTSTHERAPRQLVGFARTPNLDSGEVVDVRIALSRRPLEVWDVSSQAFTFEAGTYVVEAGQSSDSLPLRLTTMF
jgi:beta-glucosidase